MLTIAGDAVELGAAELGGISDDIVSVLSFVVGGDKAKKTMADFEKLIEQRAATGAEAALKKKVTPLVIGALAVGGVAALIAVVALVRTFR